MVNARVFMDGTLSALDGRLLLLRTMDALHLELYSPSFTSSQPMYSVQHILQRGHLKSTAHLNGLGLPLYSVVTMDHRAALCAARCCGLQVLHNNYQCLSMRQCHFLQMIALCQHLVSSLWWWPVFLPLNQATICCFVISKMKANTKDHCACVTV